MCGIMHKYIYGKTIKTSKGMINRMWNSGFLSEKRKEMG